MNDTADDVGSGRGLGPGEEEFYYEEGSILPWEFAIFATLALLIVVPNLFIVTIITRTHRLRTGTNLIFASLAVSDSLMGMVGIPLVVVASTWSFYKELVLSSAVFINFISLSTMVHILLHTCDRYVYILRALRYEDLMRLERVCAALALTWLISIFAASIRFVWALGYSELDEIALEKAERSEHIYNIVFLVAFFCLPLAVIASMDVHMLCIVHKQSQAIYQHNLHSEQRELTSGRLVARKHKAVLTCVMILLVYFFCWLPYFLSHWILSGWLLPTWAMWLMYNIRLLSSVANPWLYTLRKPDLRRATLRCFRAHFPCKKAEHHARRTTAKTEFTEETSPCLTLPQKNASSMQKLAPFIVSLQRRKTPV